jgi:hypothetical protein
MNRVPVLIVVLTSWSVFAACVDDGPVNTSSSSGSGSSSSSGGVTDAAAEANTCSVPTTTGIDCFGSGRCDPLGQICCVSLQGGGTLVGSCSPRGADGAANVATCRAKNAVVWECDRAKDCPSAASRCCLPALLQVTKRDTCPGKLEVDPRGSEPPDGRASSCVQGPCLAGTLACEKDAECGSSEKCVPIEIQGKVIGVCLK